MPNAKSAKPGRRLILNAAALMATLAVVALFVVWPRDDAGDGAGPMSGKMPQLPGAIKAFTYARGRPPAPDVALVDAEGKDVRLSAYRDKVVLLNFWATWCAPCLREMPSLDRLQAALGGADFAVVTASVDREGAKVAGPWLKARKLTHLPVILDPKSRLFRALGGTAMPTTWLLDGKGRIIGALEGAAEWDETGVQDFLRAMIAAGAG